MNTQLIGLKAANKMLPLLKSIVKDVMRLWDSIIEQRKILEEAEKKEVDTEDMKSSLNNSIDKINQYIKEIESLGGFVEEFKRGIINIPSLYHGRKIFLAVQPANETKIEFWHEIDETYSDKQSINNNSNILK